MTESKLLNISSEHIDSLVRANRLAERAIGISVLSLVIAAGSLYYAHHQVEQSRQQTDLFRRQTAIQESNHRKQLLADIKVQFDIIDGVTPEVRLVIENNSGNYVIMSFVRIDGVFIHEHPLFKPSQFKPDETEFILAPESSTMFLTVASVPTAKNTSQSTSHSALSVKFFIRDSDTLLSAVNRTVVFPRKLIFPDDYVQWMELPK
jgi:hypothetical protein